MPHEQSLARRFEEKPDIANNLAQIGIRFVPIPVATEEEFQTLAAELSRRLEQMAVEAEKNEGGSMTKYAKLDSEVLSAIGAQPTSFSKIFNPSVRQECPRHC